MCSFLVYSLTEFFAYIVFSFYIFNIVDFFHPCAIIDIYILETIISWGGGLGRIIHIYFFSCLNFHWIWWSPYFAREIPPDFFHPIQGGSEFPWPPELIPSTWASLWVSCFMKRWGRRCRLHARGRQKKRGAAWRIIPDLLREMIGFQQQSRDVNSSK